MPGFKSLSDKQKWFLFNKCVQPFLEFPPEMKQFGFRKVMKSTVKAWRTHKSKLKAQFIRKGLTPYQKHPYIEPEDWKEFVQLTESEEAKKRVKDTSCFENSTNTSTAWVRAVMKGCKHNGMKRMQSWLL